MALSELKDQIKLVPISSVIGNYISLSKKGTSLLGLCPFHADSKPSLNVNDTKGLFMCFACQTGGDAITFVEKYKRVDFKDALKEIAGVLNLRYEDYDAPKKQNPKMEMAKRILSKATHIYRKIAMELKGPEYQSFIQKRNLRDDIAQTFNLGYAAKNNTLSEYLESIKDEKERSFALAVALEIGIIRKDKTDQGSYYDTFRERIMFPIWDQFGHVAGFTSRAVFDYQKAKYMNSGESFVFNKKNILYGLHLAKSHIREQNAVLLVEGNMDLIVLHQFGFTHSVAVQGVAMSEHSINTLKNLTTNFYLGLDSDPAGFNAATRINQLCMEQGLLPKYLDFSPHKDPDEYLQKEGALPLSKIIQEAPTFVDMLLAKALPDAIPEVSDRKLELLKKLFAIVAPLGQSLLATERLAQMAARLGLKSDPAQIVKAYQEHLDSLNPKHRNISSTPSKAATVETTEPASLEIAPSEPVNTPEIQARPVKKILEPLSRAEKAVVKEITLHPDFLMHGNLSELLDFMREGEVKRYVTGLRDLIFEIDENEFPSLIGNFLNGSEFTLGLKEVAGAALFTYHPGRLEEKVVAKLLTDLKRKLKDDELSRLRGQLVQQQKECQTENETNSLMQRIGDIDKKLHANPRSP